VHGEQARAVVASARPASARLPQEERVNDRTDDSIGLARIREGRPASAVAAYQDLVVGSRSWLALLRHELLVAWGGLLPGAAGLALRQLTWRAGLFGNCGRRTVWGRNVTLWHPRNMWIGDGVAVDEGCVLDARGCAPGGFRLAEGVLISRGSIVSGKDGSLAIGARANIGAGCVMYASTKLEIGADTMLAAQCYVGGGRYAVHGRTDLPMAEQPEPRLGVVIEDDCWLGAGAVVVDGVRIGRGSVVGAGAVVTRDVEPLSIVTGVPARQVATRREAFEKGSSS
jgi:acetyltransferase-like isoleucine patch superfamily enzyme